MMPNEAATSSVTDPATRRLKVQRVKLTDLVEDEGNPRRHDERDLAATEASLKAHGQVDPLVVQKGSLRLIAGNGRKEAMRRLGWTHADVVEVECDDVEFRALSIRLNRTGELAGWDPAGLQAAIDELTEAGWGNLPEFGWDEAALDALSKGDVKPKKRNVSFEADGSGTPGTEPQLGQLEYRILVECPDESTQAKMLERLSEMGYTCRPLIS